MGRWGYTVLVLSEVNGSVIRCEELFNTQSSAQRYAAKLHSDTNNVSLEESAASVRNGDSLYKVTMIMY